ncbi:hypothetical protein Bpfe_020983 [Biomphalaria pfeifferi]|uniref:Uncharacterized protein n=1 Tax=Biomphalaria pfeifferi TaxID=112525 RepID=A0AAD8F438_BIOPF|nr:hypothetical protein Bpfe_020983 [Biomphalaria pfeifferi]
MFLRNLVLCLCLSVILLVPGQSEAIVKSPKVLLITYNVLPDGSDKILKFREGGEENIVHLEKRSMEMLSLGRSASDDGILTREKRQLRMLRLGKRQLN